MAKVIIDGYEFEEHIDGATLVDAYYIPDEEVEEYKADRDRYREIVKQIFSQWCTQVYTDFVGSQDGEAVIGKNNESYTRIYHLDPQGIANLKQAEKDGNLEEVLEETSK